LAYAAKAAAASIVGAYLGGRLGFMLINMNQPGGGGALLDFSAGYLYQTALLGGVVALPIIAKMKRRSIGSTFDVITPSLVGAWAVGNIGCFLAGCCVGQPTELPWGMKFLADATPPELRGLPVHPAQLYSMLIEVAVLVWLFARRQRFPGELCLSAVVALLVMRVLFVVVGVSSRAFSASTIAYLVVAALTAGAFFALKRRSLRLPSMQAPAETP
jgi:phosphatidylglycerol:prolipoprotein diacylglycerol transferase